MGIRLRSTDTASTQSKQGLVHLGETKAFSREAVSAWARWIREASFVVVAAEGVEPLLICGDEKNVGPGATAVVRDPCSVRPSSL